MFYTVPEHNLHLTDSPDLSRVFLGDLENLLDVERLFSWCDRSLFEDSCIDALETLYRRKKSKDITEEIDSFVSFIFFVSHRLFLEGQIFYLEGHFATAESKYLASANVIADCLRRFDTALVVSNLIENMRFLFSSICINLGMCSSRLQKFGNVRISDAAPKYNWRIPFTSRLEHWKSFEAMEWYRLSRDLCENAVSIWKQMCIAIDQMWYVSLSVLSTFRIRV